MIVSRTPFRITLGGGGTDLPSYYEHHGGFILAMGIDKYMHLAINTPLVDRRIRIQYTKSEVVRNPDELQHELAREALKRHRIFSRIEVSSIADLPAGTGLGSSSCYLVGLLHALRTYRGDLCSRQELAEEACDIELRVLRKGIGKQDQYLAAFGGMTVLEIARDGRVTVTPCRVNPATLPDFVANTMLFYTGVQRSAPDVLRDQDRAMRTPGSPEHEVVRDSLHAIAEIGFAVREALERDEYDQFGILMDRHWQHKKRMSAKITIPGIDSLYEEVKNRFGVLGGKVSGAGGGGFFIVYAPQRHAELNAFMRKAGLQRLPYGIEFEGTKIISNSVGASTPSADHDPVT
jgi:D-glycero-alpha-D-manno-heptose-7-phosphate kinase